MPATDDVKSTRWQLRVRAHDAHLVSRAAAALGVTRTDFVIAAATERARDVMADRARWDVTEEQWQAFQEALDAPPRDLPRLRELLARPAPWDR